VHLYVVTGTSKGLGRALADALAADDQNTVVEISRSVWSKNARNTALQADFAHLDQVRAAFAALAKQIEGEQFATATLINNAAIVGPVARFDQVDADELAQGMTINLIAPIVATQGFALATRNVAARRLVVNISSGAAKRVIRGSTAYCAAKAGLEMATRVAADEAAEFDSTLAIVSLAPGIIDTPMQATLRAVPAERFPDRARFENMKTSGALRDASSVAHDIIQLLQSNRLANGGNYDIRELLNA
jgi:benzil reductase ((S)-benzoin forming)